MSERARCDEDIAGHERGDATRSDQQRAHLTLAPFDGKGSKDARRPLFPLRASKRMKSGQPRCLLSRDGEKNKPDHGFGRESLLR